MKARTSRLLGRMALGCALLWAAGGCADALLGPRAPTSRAALYDEVWRQFDLHYSYFALKGVDWRAVGAAHRAEALAAPDNRAFAVAIGAMLAELRDVHVALTPNGNGPPLRFLSWCDTTPTYFASHLVERYGVLQRTSGRHVRFGMLSPTVGYLQIPSFGGDGWSGELDEALAALASARSMIVDVRDNGGGRVQLALEGAGRFVASTATYGYVRVRNGPSHHDFGDFQPRTVSPTGRARFRGPTYVLTNHRSMSAAEDFVLAMRTAPGVTVVGERTGGASGGPITRELPNGWTFQLSSWVAYTADRRTFEGVGLRPHVPVAPSPTDGARGVDTVLERALALATAARP